MVLPPAWTGLIGMKIQLVLYAMLSGSEPIGSSSSMRIIAFGT